MDMYTTHKTMMYMLVQSYNWKWNRSSLQRNDQVLSRIYTKTVVTYAALNSNYILQCSDNAPLYLKLISLPGIEFLL